MDICYNIRLSNIFRRFLLLAGPPACFTATMTEVAISRSHHRHNSSIGSMSATMTTSAPVVEMVQNPAFSFPIMKPRTPSPSGQSSSGSPYRRPASVHLAAPDIQVVRKPHARAGSTALPAFSFNATNVSGRSDTPPLTPEELVTNTPSKQRGHRRERSELVGGTSVSTAISSSPTKIPGMCFPPPLPAASHRHRRSVNQLSSHDVSSIMMPTELPIRMSSSLPSTPLEHPSHLQAPPFDRSFSAPAPAHILDDTLDPFGPVLDSVSPRPASRRLVKVGFSDNIEYIPRPLSTISSDSEGTMSTIRGHSVNNSISSMLSLGTTPSPPSSRMQIRSPSPVSEPDSEPRSRAKSSIDVKRLSVEKEGEWLKSRSSSQDMMRPEITRPLSEPAVSTPNISFAPSEPPAATSRMHSKRHSLGQMLGFERRRSEPSISMRAGEASRQSTISLQEPVPEVPKIPETERARLERKSSTKRIKAWATSKMSRKSKDVNRLSVPSMEREAERPESAGSVEVPGKVPISEPPIAEMDLDAVFSVQSTFEDTQRISTPPQPRIEFSTPTPSHTSSFHSQDLDDTSLLVDLDAALGPNRTPPMSAGDNRRARLHSSRQAVHRRAESLPVMPAVEFGGNKVSTPSQSSMADVFEEDEEDDTAPIFNARPSSQRSTQEEDTGIGISIVDAANTSQGSAPNWSFDDGLRIQRGEWEPERPTTSYGNMNSRLSTPIMDHRRSSSIIEETIIEEVSPIEAPVEPVQIVESHEEPRTSSLTKSSDSSETPTLLGAQTVLLDLPGGQQLLMTPDTYQTSTFSSPDFGRHQGSFDTSRLGTSASSITDNRTMSSCNTGEHGQEVRMSVDDVPSLTSSRSTMMSTMHANGSRRDFSDRSTSVVSANPEPMAAADRRRKRASIQSLSQLVGGSFGSKTKSDEQRPQTSNIDQTQAPKKKEHRLKKLMFWKSKQSSRPAPSSNKLHKDRQDASFA